MRQYDVIVIGEINADLILGDRAKPIFGQAETLLKDATLTLGGSGVIFACGCARLGLRVGYCGVVGTDMFGQYMLESMAARDVDTAGVIVDPATKTGLSVILNDSGDRAILTHPGSIDELTADRVNRSFLACASHIHVSSYFLQKALQPGLADLLAEVSANGATVSLDTNWDPAQTWNHGLRAVLANIDVFLPNAKEAVAITGEQELDAAVLRLAKIVPTVAVKLGGDGACSRRGTEAAQDSGFTIDVVDTTGAGDSFDAGFVYGYLREWSMADTLAMANACGALSTRMAGGTDSQPTLQEAQALIHQRREGNKKRSQRRRH